MKKQEKGITKVQAPGQLQKAPLELSSARQSLGPFLFPGPSFERSAHAQQVEAARGDAQA